MFQRVSKSEKVYGPEAGRRVSSFSIENFLSHSAEKFRRGTLLRCFSENFRLRKSLSIRGEEGRVSSFSVGKILSHSGERIRRRWGGEYQDVPSKKFCITPESFHRGFLECFLNFSYRISLDKRGGIKRFRRKYFGSQRRKTSYKNPSMFHYFRVSKSFML